MGQYGKPLIIGFILAFAVAFVLGLAGGAAGVDLGVMPMFAGLFVGGFTAYILANLAGTKAGPTGTVEQKRVALGAPTSGKGRLIVMRQGFVAMAAGLNVAVDNRVVAQLKSPNWTAVDLDPGAHSLSAAFTGLAEKQSNAAQTAFEVREGEVVVFKLGVSLGALKNSIKAERVATDETVRRQLESQKMVLPAP